MLSDSELIHSHNSGINAVSNYTEVIIIKVSAVSQCNAGDGETKFRLNK